MDWERVLEDVMCGYKDCYVAFIDILGFNQIINEYSFEAIKHIFDEIKIFKPTPL